MLTTAGRTFLATGAKPLRNETWLAISALLSAETFDGLTGKPRNPEFPVWAVIQEPARAPRIRVTPRIVMVFLIWHPFRSNACLRRRIAFRGSAKGLKGWIAGAEPFDIVPLLLENVEVALFVSHEFFKYLLRRGVRIG